MSTSSNDFREDTGMEYTVHHSLSKVIQERENPSADQFCKLLATINYLEKTLGPFAWALGTFRRVQLFLSHPPLSSISSSSVLPPSTMCQGVSIPIKLLLNYPPFLPPHVPDNWEAALQKFHASSIKNSLLNLRNGQPNNIISDLVPSQLSQWM